MSHENVKNRLLKEHPADMYGVWHIRGEDDNCDLGGSHYMPTLGYFEGEYEDIVELAVGLRGFFSWGGGGDIRLIDVKKVDKSVLRQISKTKVELAQIEQRQQELTKQLDSLEKQHVMNKLSSK